MDESSNIAAILPRMAAERGEQVAMRCPGSHGFGSVARYDSVLTYAQLEARSNAIAAGTMPATTAMISAFCTQSASPSGSKVASATCSSSQPATA